MNERRLPPMFDKAVGQGDPCGLCMHRASRRTVKVLLPNGVQVCKECDA